MRIVDVNPFFLPFIGGIELRMDELAKRLASRGHEVIILTSRLPGTEEEEIRDGFRIVRVKSKFIDLYNPPYVKSYNVLETLESLDADVVNYNYRWSLSWNKALNRYGGKKMFTYHNMWGEGLGIFGKISEMNDNNFAKGLKSYGRIVTVSEYVRDDLIKRGFSPDIMEVIPPGYNCQPLEECQEGDFILSLGRLVKTKGLDYLIEAMRDVDCKLIICGRGPEEKHLRKLISKYGLEDRVEMKGFVDDAEKQRLMSTCKFFVIPSIFESFGLAALEQMASGKPVIHSDANGLPSVVKEGGIMVRKADSKELADAMNRLLSDDGLRHDLSEKARRRAETFAWDGIVDRYESFLQDYLRE